MLHNGSIPIPTMLRNAERCYAEALESDRTNVRVARYLATLYATIRDEHTCDAVTHHTYARRAAVYEKRAAKLEVRVNGQAGRPRERPFRIR
jgi:transcriptional regulator